MKSFKLLLVAVFATLLVIPFTALAQEEGATEEAATEETTQQEDRTVTLYLFRGEGCSHCAEFEEWIESIQGEYGSLFKVVDYETWNNQDNAKLMTQVAEVRGENDDQLGVPYIIIGNKSWKGFAEDYKAEILEKIQTEYETPVADRYDIMKYVDTDKKEEKEVVSGTDVVVALVIVAVICGVGFGLYKARKSTN